MLWGNGASKDSMSGSQAPVAISKVISRSSGAQVVGLGMHLEALPGVEGEFVRQLGAEDQESHVDVARAELLETLQELPDDAAVAFEGAQGRGTGQGQGTGAGVADQIVRSRTNTVRKSNQGLNEPHQNGKSACVCCIRVVFSFGKGGGGGSFIVPSGWTASPR